MNIAHNERYNIYSRDCLTISSLKLEKTENVIIIPTKISDLRKNYVPPSNTPPRLSLNKMFSTRFLQDVFLK